MQEICKNSRKKPRYQKEWKIFGRIFKSFLSSQSACFLLPIIVCNTSKVVTSRVKLLEKPFQKWCKNGHFDLRKDVPFSKTTLVDQWRQQFFQIKSLTPKRFEGYQFENLTLSLLDFPKIIFLEKQQNPAICDFFRKYEDLLH